MDTPDEADISLIHALQLRPRASWRQLADALGEGPATLSRRWARLRESGLSWVMAYPSVDGVHGNRLAITEIACGAGRVMSLAQELAGWPMVVTAEIAAREYGVVVAIAGLNQSDLADILLDRLPKLDGVTGMRTHLVGQFHLGANQWRIGGLDPHAAAKLAGASLPADHPARATAINPWADPYRELVDALTEDGRYSAADLARITGRPLSTTRRQLAQLLGSGALTFRCDVAQGVTGYPVIVQWWCKVPVAQMAASVARLRGEPSVRQVVSMPGSPNLLVTTWNRSVADAMRIQEALERELAPLVVVDSAVILHQVKRLGWLLDSSGRNTGTFVPYSTQGAVKAPARGHLSNAPSREPGST